MDSCEEVQKDEGVRLRKNLMAEQAEEVTTEEEDGKSTDLVSRIFGSTKELAECMPTDLPSAKRMVG